MANSFTLKEMLERNLKDLQEKRDNKLIIFDPEKTPIVWRSILLQGINNLVENLDAQWESRITAIESLINIQVPEIIQAWVDAMEVEDRTLNEAIQETFRGPLMNKTVKEIVVEAKEDLIVVSAKCIKGRDSDQMTKEPLFVIAAITYRDVMFFFKDQYDQSQMGSYFQLEDSNPAFRQESDMTPAQVAAIFSDFLNYMLRQGDAPNGPDVHFHTPETMRQGDAPYADLNYLRAWELLNKQG
jgi:hypothetical protein